MAVFLTPVHGSFQMPDGTTRPVDAAAGQAMLTPAGQHKPKNLGKTGFEVIQVELKQSSLRGSGPLAVEKHERRSESE